MKEKAYLCTMEVNIKAPAAQKPTPLNEAHAPAGFHGARATMRAKCPK